MGRGCRVLRFVVGRLREAVKGKEYCNGLCVCLDVLQEAGNGLC